MRWGEVGLPSLPPFSSAGPSGIWQVFLWGGVRVKLRWGGERRVEWGEVGTGWATIASSIFLNWSLWDLANLSRGEVGVSGWVGS